MAWLGLACCLACCLPYQMNFGFLKKKFDYINKMIADDIGKGQRAPPNRPNRRTLAKPGGPAEQASSGELRRALANSCEQAKPANRANSGELWRTLANPGETSPEFARVRPVRQSSPEFALFARDRQSSREFAKVRQGSPRFAGVRRQGSPGVR